MFIKASNSSINKADAEVAAALLIPLLPISFIAWF